MTLYKTQRFNEIRTFGVEIEFKGDRGEVATQMRALGLSVVVVGYTHDVMSAWKLTTDASAEWELVSPILKGRQGLEDLKRACQALNVAGARVDKSCGLHIHHCINDYSVEDAKSLFATYAKTEKVMDTFVSASRRGSDNRFCQPVANGVNGTYGNVQEFLNKLRTVKTIQQLNNFFTTRYLKLNFQSYVKYGTVEFRQHQGTIDFTKMYNWILLTQQLVNNAKDRHVSYQYNPIYWDTMGYFSEVSRMTAKYGADEELANVLTWFRQRSKELATATGR